MNKRLNEAIEAVDTLNELWYEQTKNEDYLPFDLVYSSGWMGIKFFDSLMWDDNDNDCDYIDKDDEYCDEREPIITCVSGRVQTFLDLLKGFTP